METSTDGELTFSNNTVITDVNLLNLALNASISGIIVTDNKLPDNPIIYCNSAFEVMTGYNRSEIIGHNCRFLQIDDRLQNQRDSLRQAVETGGNCVVEIRNYKKNGELFWNELYMSPIRDVAGEVTHFIGVQNDITRRKNAELELIEQKKTMERRILGPTKSIKEREDYLASIVATVRERFIVLDPNFIVLSANNHFLTTFKVSREETVGKHFYELGNGQWNIPQLKYLLESILPTNSSVEHFEVEHDFPHIGKKLMQVNAHRVELEGQYKDRILLAIEDITNVREIEKRKDDFLSIASHELKTPLTTIRGYVQMLEDSMPEDADEKYRTVLEKTSLHVNRLNNLISELLDVSRIKSGNFELYKAPFDFDKVVTETVEAIQAASKRQGIIITGSTGVIYRGDESHIIQVVTNLLANAIKYAPGSEEIRVHFSLVSDYLKFSVTDQGMGISAEDQKKIFDRFFRVNEIQQKFPGMGIGLYISDQIIKNHGGTLWVESEKGLGSTVNFTLPLNEIGKR